MAGELVYFVIPVPDAERARSFYGSVLGWRFEPGNVPGGYHITNATPPGGLHGGGEGSSPQVFFSVDDIEAALARVRGLGGEADVVQESAGDSGRYVRCRDDQGTEFWLWQSAS